MSNDVSLSDIDRDNLDSREVTSYHDLNEDLMPGTLHELLKLGRDNLKSIEDNPPLTAFGVKYYLPDMYMYHEYDETFDFTGVDFVGATLALTYSLDRKISITDLNDHIENTTVIRKFLCMSQLQQGDMETAIKIMNQIKGIQSPHAVVYRPFEPMTLNAYHYHREEWEALMDKQYEHLRRRGM